MVFWTLQNIQVDGEITFSTPAQINCIGSREEDGHSGHYKWQVLFSYNIFGLRFECITKHVKRQGTLENWESQVIAILRHVILVLKTI